MEAFVETTQWDVPTPAHVYLLDGDKAVAYQNALDGSIKYFKKPIQISKRGRTFLKAKVNPFKLKSTDDIITVPGSKGVEYVVNLTKKTCNCPGFSFRGKCKHVA
jgi:hypothetical protein